MSVLALPLTPPDITNAHHYIFKQEDANHDEDPTKALGAFESEDWSRFGLSSGLIGPTPPTLRIYSGHAQSRTSDVSGSGRVEPYGYERYESYGSEFLKPDEVSMPEEVREPIQLKLKVEGGIEADVHDFMTKYARPHDASPSSASAPMSVKHYAKSINSLGVGLIIEAASTDAAALVKLRIGHVTFGDADMYMFIYSTSARASFKQINDHPRFVRFSKDTKEIPIMIVGKRKFGSHVREVTLEEGAEFAKSNGCMFAEVYEADYEAVNHLFCRLVETKWNYGLVKTDWNYDGMVRIERQRVRSLALARSVKRQQRQSKGIAGLFGLRTEKTLWAIGEE